MIHVPRAMYISPPETLSMVYFSRSFRDSFSALSPPNSATKATFVFEAQTRCLIFPSATLLSFKVEPRRPGVEKRERGGAKDRRRTPTSYYAFFSGGSDKGR